MEKINQWAKSQIKKVGGTPCTAFYKVGPVHVGLFEMAHWDTPTTMLMVIHKTVQQTVAITEADKGKIKKILKSLAKLDPSVPATVKACKALGIDEALLNAVQKE
jgi:hypothetical protein